MKKLWGIPLAAAIGTTFLWGMTEPAKSHVRCNVEVSGGIASGTTSIQIGPGLDVGQDGGLAGAGLGCDLYLDKPFLVGIMARYSVSDIDGNLLGATFETDNIWEVAFRAGVYLNQSVLLYGLVGVTGADIKVTAGPFSFKESATGLLLGGGLEAELPGNWAARLEYTYHDFGDTDLFGFIPLETDLHVVRAALLYRFNGVPWEKQATAYGKPLK